MDDFDSVHAARVGGTSTVTLFLGLFLLVLAFFIILVSISTIQETKSREVMDSLTSTFADLAGPVTDPTDFASKQGEVLSADDFQQHITGVFSTAFTVDRVVVVQPGRIMRVDFQARTLFVDGKPEIRNIRLEFMDRVMSSLSASPPGYRFEMAFLIGSPLSDSNNLPVTETLELARAGAFARKAIERGAPPHAVSVGVIPGKSSDVTIYFYVREEAAARLQFDLPVEQGFQYDDDNEVEPAAPVTPSSSSTVPDNSLPVVLSPKGGKQ
jgi:hypothetical protein